MPEWTQATFASTIIALEAWILIELVKLKIANAETKTEMKERLGRIESDIESEKDTANRVHERIFQQIRELEKKA